MSVADLTDQAKNQIILGHTISSPFVEKNLVCFRGTKDQLMRVDKDGGNERHIAGCTTTDAPFMNSGVVYYRGSDTGLYRVDTDGKNSKRINDNTTASTPFVTGGVVYFRGTDNQLWRIDTDGKNQRNVGGNMTKSSPFVHDGWVYFQGTDDRATPDDTTRGMRASNRRPDAASRRHARTAASRVMASPCSGAATFSTKQRPTSAVTRKTLLRRDRSVTVRPPSTIASGLTRPQSSTYAATSSSASTSAP
jgi:hypothetical protein